MYANNIDTSLWLDIGHGLRLGENNGEWLVASDKGIFNLRDDADYFRAVTLLEMPYQNAVALLNDYEKRKQSKQPFPIEKVVRIGLIAKSELWAEKAVSWLPNLSQELREGLVSAIQEVIDSKWANQKTRQLASREINRIKH